MAVTAVPDGREVQPLCFRFSATFSQRLQSTPREHLGTPADLAAWFVAAGLLPEPPAVDGALLDAARALREAIYRAARRVAVDGSISRDDRELINSWAARNDAVRVLDDDGARWRVPDHSPVPAALGIVAADAVDTLGGARTGTVKVCEGERCVAVFLDSSRARTRRWCSMGTCGNRAKKSAIRRRRDRVSSTGTADGQPPATG